MSYFKVGKLIVKHILIGMKRYGHPSIWATSSLFPVFLALFRIVRHVLIRYMTEDADWIDWAHWIEYSLSTLSVIAAYIHFEMKDNHFSQDMSALVVGVSVVFNVLIKYLDDMEYDARCCYDNEDDDEGEEEKASNLPEKGNAPTMQKKGTGQLRSKDLMTNIVGIIQKAEKMTYNGYNTDFLCFAQSLKESYEKAYSDLAMEKEMKARGYTAERIVDCLLDNSTFNHRINLARQQDKDGKCHAFKLAIHWVHQEFTLSDAEVLGVNPVASGYFMS